MSLLPAGFVSFVFCSFKAVWKAQKPKECLPASWLLCMLAYGVASSKVRKSFASRHARGSRWPIGERRSIEFVVFFLE